MSSDGKDVNESTGRRGGTQDEALRCLVGAIQELSGARHLPVVQQVVTRAARALTGCAGATFVLLDEGQCYYAYEDAIAPLWQGKRFPLEACISGWVIQNGTPAAIADIYADPRIPHEAYRPTFVKSLLMVPIRSANPLGALGAYWAAEHRASERETALLQALADTASVALENVQLYADLARLVRDKPPAYAAVPPGEKREPTRH